MPEIKYTIIPANKWPAYRDALEPAEALLAPLIPAHSLTLLHGPPGCGKSAFLWGCGDAIARGVHYMGIPTKQTNVLLISTDMNDYQLKHRWQLSFEPSFSVCPADSFDCLSPAFRTSGFYKAVQEYIVRNHVGLVMIDALSGIALGHSVKDDETANAVVPAIESWLGNVAIVLLHHDRKQRFTPQGQPIPPSDEDFLGSQQWRSNCTSQLHMFVAGPHRSTLKHAKSQVDVLLEDELSLYIDMHGKAELWQQHRADEVANKWLESVAFLKCKDWPMMEQYEAVAKLHGVKVRTAQRWRDLAVK